eukprot:GHUV01055499.1.p1 GENE.GHUV01055499.1~~GHUV01055499.1.p1  ORF type:complete len:135 (-),score=28.63 GHUV01055499.1:267-617(-)
MMNACATSVCTQHSHLHLPFQAINSTYVFLCVCASQIEEDPTGGKLAAQMGKLGGAPHKLDNITHFHVGDTITALQRAVMQPGGSEVLLYGTIMGGVGAMFPFQSKEVSLWDGAAG